MSYIPSNIQLGRPAVFRFDNNDILEETLSGKGSTHCTNDILVQRSANTAVIVEPRSFSQLHCNSETSRRTYKRHSPLPLCDIQDHVLRYTAGRRCYAPLLSSSPNVDNLIKCERSGKCDFLWLLSRISKQHSAAAERDADEMQTVPGWSGFNAQLKSTCIPASSVIGYLPVINASPTELSTVYTVLRQCLEKAQLPQQRFAMVTFDQAIYAKAREVM